MLKETFGGGGEEDDSLLDCKNEVSCKVVRPSIVEKSYCCDE